MSWDLLQHVEVSLFTEANTLVSFLAQKLRLSPFMRETWILTADTATKDHLAEELVATHKLTLFGTHITTLSKGLASLLKKAYSGVLPPLPQKAELAFNLYLHLKETTKETQHERLLAEKASHEAAELFHALRYLNPKMLKKKAFPLKEKLLAQKTLLTEALNTPLSIRKNSLQIFLAGIGELTESELLFFQNLSQYVPVEILALTSCVMFHQDFLSKKQKKHLIASLQEKEASLHERKELLYYLEQQNPLLANNGLMQRKALDLLEKAHPQPKEFYTLPEALAQTLLEKIQKDLLHAEAKEGKEEVKEKVPSLLFTRCATKQEEVEALYHLLENRCALDSSLQPKEIVVFCQDLETYAPYIDTVFGHDESQLPYYIEMPSPSSLIDTFFLIAKLPLTRVENTTLITLLENPFIQRLIGLKKMQVQKCRLWIKEAAMRWGWDGSHKKSWIQKTIGRNTDIPQEESGTWKQGKKRLLETLFHIGEEEPSFAVDQGDLSCLEGFFQLLDDLENHFRAVEMHPQRKVKEWSEYLLSLYQTFFPEVEEEGADSLLSSFAAFSFESSQTICYEGFITLFEKQKQNMNRAKKSSVNCIRFLQAAEEPLFIAKIAAYLGCQEEKALQEKQSVSLYFTSAFSIPSKKQKRRAHFLRTLTLTQQGLYFFASSEHPHFLSFIEELLEYAKDHYILDAPILRTYSSPREKDALNDPVFGSTFLSDREVVKQLSKKMRLAPRVQLACGQEEQVQEEILTVSDLSSFLEHPVKHYIRRKIGLYLEEENPFTNTAPLFPDPLSLWQERENIFEGLIKGKNFTLPDEKATGLFWAAANQDLKEFSWLAKHTFEENRLKKEAFSTLVFAEGGDAPAFLWEKEGKKVQLTGKIARYSDGTIAINASFSHEKWIKVLPQLALIQAAKLHKEPKALFLKDRKVFVLPQETDSKDLLEAMITFYLKGKDRCLPLLPKVAFELAFGNTYKAQDKLQKSFENYQKPDPYMRWAFSEESSIKIAEYKREFQPCLHTIFKHYLKKGKR